jgi:hypothetical protein
MSGTPTQANRALAILSSLMNWVAGRKWREGNPCRGVVRFKEPAVNRYPTPGQLQRIRDAIDELGAEGRLNLFRRRLQSVDDDGRPALGNFRGAAVLA